MGIPKKPKNHPAVAPAKANLPAIIAEYASGAKTLKQLAEKNGIARITLYQWMLSDLGKGQYDDLITQALIARISEADAELEGAADSLALARARELMRFTRMDFERRRPHLYGQKQELSVQVAPILHISVVSEPQMPVIDVTPARVEEEKP